MSYSFTVTAATKAEAKQKVASKFDEVVQGQPVHAVDRAQAQAAAEAFIDVLSAPRDDQQVEVRLNGSLSWRSEGDFTGAYVGVAAILTPA